MENIFRDNIKAILFDMDGVVIDSEKLYSQSEEKLLSKYGVKFDDSDWLKIKGCTEKQFYDFVYSKFNLSIQREKLMSQGKEFLKHANARVIYPPKEVELFNRLIGHTKNFFLISAYGAFTPGYVMLITKKLLPAMNMIDDSHLDEFKWLVSKVIDAINQSILAVIW